MTDTQFKLLMQEIKKNSQDIADIKQDIVDIKQDIADIKQEQFAMKKMSFKNNLDLNKKIDDYMEINSRQYHQIEDLLEKKYQESLNDRRKIHEDINTLHALIKMYHGETA